MKKVLLAILFIIIGFGVGMFWKYNSTISKPDSLEVKSEQSDLIKNKLTKSVIDKEDDSEILKSSGVEVKESKQINFIQEYEKEIVNLFENSSSSVVFITTSTYKRDSWTRNIYEIPSGTGSGFVWDDEGHIITNYHVIKDARKIEITLSDHSSWEAKLIGSSPNKDIAILKIDIPANKLNIIEKGKSSDLRVGQFVMAIGNPFGLDQTLTTGVISALGREIQSPAQIPIRDIIQIDAAINPGNSGGPLLNSLGELIGVNTAIYSPSGASAGIGFAIPVDVVNWVVTDIIKYGEVRRPFLGVGMIPENYARSFGVETGALISSVYPDSPAEKMGIKGTTNNKLGDIIIGLNEEKIKSNTDLFLALEKYKPNENVSLTIIRDEKEIKLETILGSSN